MNRMTRKAVIGELRELKHIFQRCYDKYPTCLEEAIDYIDQTPQPERKKGKWQITDAYPHNVYCSECHKKFAQTHWAVWEDGSLPRNFCPNCGARMEMEE